MEASDFGEDYLFLPKEHSKVSHKWTSRKEELPRLFLKFSLAALLLIVVSTALFNPSTPPATVWNEQTYQHCLKDKRLLILGNSIMRGFMYDMVVHIDPSLTFKSRYWQKAQCGAGGTYEIERESMGQCFGLCHCNVNNLTTLSRLEFAWDLQIANPNLESYLIHNSSAWDAVLMMIGADMTQFNGFGQNFANKTMDQIPELTETLQNFLEQSAKSKVFIFDYLYCTEGNNNGCPFGVKNATDFVNQALRSEFKAINHPNIRMVETNSLNLGMVDPKHLNHNGTKDLLHAWLDEYCTF